MDKSRKISLFSLVLNIAYSAYHITFGRVTQSWWLFTIGVYYIILSAVRFVVLRAKSKDDFAAEFTGIMLMLLALPLVGTVILAGIRDRGIVLHEIVMVAMAVYAFTKITLATVNFIRSRRSRLVRLITLRNISFANALVSIFSLQRSMLVSFEGMSESEVRIMNVATGSAVCVIVFLLGLNLLRNKKSI